MSSRPSVPDMRPASEVAEALWRRFVVLDSRITTTLGKISFPLIRISLAVVFLWFGLLKILDVSPVSDLLSRTVYWLDASWFVPVLGIIEVSIGASLLIGRGLRLVLPMFAAQMLGTFLVLVVMPDVAFQQGNPFLLTTEGEFVVKNLVLFSAGLAVGARVQRPRPWSAARSEPEEPSTK